MNRKKSVLLTCLLMASLMFLAGARRRYGPFIWQTVSGGIQYIGGNVNITNGTLTALSLNVATDVYIEVKTVIKTFDVNAADASDDYQFDNTAANASEQTIEIASAIPAYAEILSAQVRCFETLVSSGTDVMAIDVGTSDGGAEILATADTDTANDINATAAGTGPEVVATNAARSVWVNATPSANWDTLTEGRWSVMVTYIDYQAVHTAKSP